MTIIKWIKKRIRENKNAIILVCGPTGSGKSYIALKLAKVLDPTFNINERVCFTIREFLEVLMYGNLKKGNVVILDEIGVSFSARDWYTMINKVMSQTLQTFRHRNLIVFMTTPTKKFLDAHGRMLIHAYIETENIDFDKKLNIFKFYEIKVNPRTGDVYNYCLCDEGGAKVLSYTLDKPDYRNIRVYEKKKSEVLGILDKDLLKIAQGEIPETYNKKDRIKRRLLEGEDVIDICKVEETTPTYVYQCKHELKSSSSSQGGI